MGSASYQYGLDLNRGLYFAGKLNANQASLLGAYAMAVLAEPENTPTSVTIKGLLGNIMGFAARSASLEASRKLTVAPVLGIFSMVSVDHLMAKVNRYAPAASSNLTIGGIGFLHIPQMELYQKYQTLLPGTEYVTDYRDETADSLTVTLAKQQGFDFSICIE